MKRVSMYLVLVVLLSWASDWPQVYHDPAHTSAMADQGPSTPVLTWSYEVGPALGSGWDYIHTSSPAVVDGRVYVGSISGIVYCFDAETGPPAIWTKDLHDTIFCSPAVVNGRVYAGTWGGSTNYMYCLDATTGDSLWRYQLSPSGKIEQGPTVSDGRVFFGAWYNNYIYCLDAYTGTLLWRATPEPGYMWGHGGLPAVHDSLVFVGASEYPTGDTKFYAYTEYPTGNTGEVVWVYTVSVDATHQAFSVSEGRVFASVDAGWLYCLNEYPPTPSGEEFWSVRSAPGYSGDPSCISVEGNTIYYGHEVGWTYCRDALSSTLQWQSPYLGGHCGVGSPAVTPTKLYLGTGYAGGGPSTQALFCLDKVTGDTMWSYPTGGFITSTPAVSNGMVFFTSHDGYLYALGEWLSIDEISTPSRSCLSLQIEANLFSHTTEIRFHLPISDHVSLKIYDVTGRLVETLIDRPLKAGEHKIRWSPEITSGIYFLRLKTGNFSAARKITVLR